jgi:hypothetical protein
MCNVLWLHETAGSLLMAVLAGRSTVTVGGALLSEACDQLGGSGRCQRAARAGPRMPWATSTGEA